MPDDEILSIWYASHANLHDLAEHLVRHHDYDAENLLELLDKPWHFHAEWHRYESYGEGETAATEDLREAGRVV